MAHLVRDEGVAGSNPATPTISGPRSGNPKSYPTDLRLRMLMIVITTGPAGLLCLPGASGSRRETPAGTIGWHVGGSARFLSDSPGRWAIPANRIVGAPVTSVTGTHTR